MILAEVKILHMSSIQVHLVRYFMRYRGQWIEACFPLSEASLLDKARSLPLLLLDMCAKIGHGTLIPMIMFDLRHMNRPKKHFLLQMV